MLPTSSMSRPPMPPAQGGDAATVAFRRALGVPTNQPAPEAKVIQAMEGKLGPQVKQMAMGLATGPSAGGPNPPTTPDAGQPGGEAAPPDPKGPETADSPAVTPGANGGGMKSSEIFGRAPVGTIGAQKPAGDDDEDDTPGASAIFRR